MYLMLSTGFSQYMHLCMTTDVQQYSLIGLQIGSDDPCPLCTSLEQGLAQQKDDCCKLEMTQLRTDELAKTNPHFDFTVKIWGDIIPNRMLGAVFDPAAERASKHLYSTSTPPSLIEQNPLYIFHCVYRI